MTEGFLRSLDGVTSPVSLTRGLNNTVEVTLFMDEKGFERLMKAAGDADNGLEKAIDEAFKIFTLRAEQK